MKSNYSLALGMAAIVLSALLMGSAPSSARDFLAPLTDMIDALTPAPPPRSKPAPAKVPAPIPPQPRPRPDFLSPKVAAPEPVPLPTAPTPPVATAPTAPAPAAPDQDMPAPAAPSEAAPVQARIYQTACPAVIAGLVEAEALPPLSEGECGEQSPLSVTAILANGRMVPLSTPMITNCEMASALPGWVAAVDGYLASSANTRLKQIDIGTSYMCRNRNNAEVGLTSEHGFADALDVAGFSLIDGRTITVLDNWLPAAAPDGRLLRYVHDAACSGFSTVLGPDANALHNDHFHLDLGCHGKSCTSRMCQ